MNDSFNLYNKRINKKKDDEESIFKKVLFSYIVKALIVIALFLGALIYIKQGDKQKSNLKNIVYTNSISFAKIYNLYNKYLGDAIPFKNTKEDKTIVVSNQKLVYKSIKKEDNGYILEVNDITSVSALRSGIVTSIEKDDKYKTIITIQDKEESIITYGLVEDINIKLYDYVKKGEIIGNANKKLYLEFKKDNKYLSYEEYL